MIWRRLAWLALTVATLAAGAQFAAAHETTRSYVTLEREGRGVEARLRVAFRDIEVATWIDEDLDGRITWGETRRRLDAIEAYVRSGFALRAGGPCELARTGTAAAASGGIAYLDLQFRGQCPDAEAPLTVRSRLFDDIDPGHRMFLQASLGGAITLRVLSATEPSVELGGDTGGIPGSLLGYFRAGIEHLTGGADHLVFLLALMLPAVCPSGSARRATLGVVTAATGFTLAHALTLTAATTDLLRPPTDLINALIALSIVITAIDNVRPFVPAPRVAVAAFFGIIHGFGFAGALSALQLTGGSLVVALLGFNLGVEAAQIGVVLAAMPALYMLGGGRALLWAGSIVTFAAGAWWLWARLAPLAPVG